MADANKHQRVIELEDESLRALITEKGQLVESGRAISREMEALKTQFEEMKKELETLAGKVGTASRRIFKKVQKATKGQLGEYEMPLTTEIRDGKVVLIVEDALEVFKDSIKTQDKYSAPGSPTRELATSK